MGHIEISMLNMEIAGYIMVNKHSSDCTILVPWKHLTTNFEFLGNVLLLILVPWKYTTTNFSYTEMSYYYFKFHRNILLVSLVLWKCSATIISSTEISCC